MQGDLQALLDRLSGWAKTLPARGDNIEVLNSPNDFFQALLEGLRSAQAHITIASLYFGTGGGREREFADALAAAAHDASRPALRIRILLDALRSTRPTPGSADNGGGGAALTSTAEMLATRLLEGAPGGGGEAQDARVAVSLFHTPALRGLLKRVLPPRVCEVVGVMHCKVYCFDDTVIISGANISSTYLSTRQDRYIVVRAAPQLAALLRQAVDTVGRYAYQLLPLPAAASMGDDAWDGSGTSATRRRDVLLELLQQQRLPWQQPSQRGGAASSGAVHGTQRPPVPHHLQRHPQQRQQRYRLGPCPASVDPVRQAYMFSALFQRELLQLFVPPHGWPSVLDVAALAQQEEAAAGEPASAASVQGMDAAAGLHSRQESAVPTSAAAEQGEVDTWIVPLVQAGFAGVRQDERCTLAMLEWAVQQHAAGSAQGAPDSSSIFSSRASSRSGGRWAWSKGRSASAYCGSSALLQLASPYLNLARPYEWFLARKADAADLELITASPEANGFFGSKGVSAYVPLAYSLLEHRTWRRLTRSQRRGGTDAWRTRRLAWQRRWTPNALQPQHLAAAADAVPPGLPSAGEAGSAPAGPTRRLWEYCRPGWEFHAKGIWVSLPADQQQQQQQARQHQQQPSSLHPAAQQQQQQAPATPRPWAAPTVTAVGSSNYGFRSLHRDIELQFLLLTRNPGLRRTLGQEVAALQQHCVEVAGEAHFQAPGRRGGAVARLAVRLLRGFL